MVSLYEETALARQVVRVRVRFVRTYEVVFDDGEPVYVGAVTRRSASRTWPKAGQIVDTHRTARDARGTGRHDSAAPVLKSAAAQLACGAGVIGSAPSLVDQAHAPRIVGRPAESSARAIQRLRRRIRRLAAAPCLR
jgi:hypothetical protein